MFKLKSVWLAMALGIMAAQSRADQTNLVQNINIQLGGIKQGGTVTSHGWVVTEVTTVRLNDQDFIAALGAATGNTFSHSAQLLLISPLPSGPASVAVQDGTSRVDVSRFFLFEQKSGSLFSSVGNVRTGHGSHNEYSIERFALVDADGFPTLGLHFDVQGIATATQSTADNRGPRNELNAEVTGSGDSAGNLLLLQGTIRIHGSTLEVVTGGTPPPA